MAHSVDEKETLGGALQDIRAFCRVVELGSISAAARILGETKGGISRRISRLESTLSLQLLARHPRSVSVTSEGEIFYGKAREGILLLDEGAELARATRSEPRGTLRITAPLDLGHEWLPQLIVAFVERHPQIRVELLSSDERLDLATHQIDIALRATAGGLPDMGYSAKSLIPLRMGLFASPTYLTQHGAPQQPDDLYRHALVLAGTGAAGIRLQLQDEAGAHHYLTLQPRLQSSDYSSVLRLTLAGGGIGYFPQLIAEQAIKRGELRPLLTEWQSPMGELFLITMSGLRTPTRVQAFRAFLLERLAEGTAK
ncbi:MAG: LysR family transcriptional regulator [Aeromonadaceae bacterium]